MSLQKFDPTRTTTLRNNFVRGMNLRFGNLKNLIYNNIVVNDVFGLKKRKQLKFLVDELPSRAFEYKTNPEKVEEFMDWLGEMNDTHILEVTQREGRRIVAHSRWMNTYIGSAYRRGIARADAEIKKVLPSYEGIISPTFVAPIHADEVGVLYIRAFEDLKGITSQMSTQISRTLSEGMAQGKNPNTIARELAKKVDDIGIRRARTLARTEIIRAHHVANVNRYLEAGLENVTVRAEWSTAGSRVCFVKGTKVNTNKGMLPIEDIKKDDFVYTSKGLKQVRETKKSLYTGRLLKIKIKNTPLIIVTEEHPFKLFKGRWVLACDLTLNDFPESIDNKPLQILSIENIFISNRKTRYVFFIKEFSFSLISKFISFFRMPIDTVCLKGNTCINKKKINRIPLYRKFLDIFNIKRFKTFSNSFFKRRFSCVSNITSCITKYLIGFRFFTKFSSTCFANCKMRRSSTFFRTIFSNFPSKITSPTKLFLASLAFNKNCCRCLWRFFRRHFLSTSITKHTTKTIGSNPRFKNNTTIFTFKRKEFYSCFVETFFRTVYGPIIFSMRYILFFAKNTCFVYFLPFSFLHKSYVAIMRTIFYCFKSCIKFFFTVCTNKFQNIPPIVSSSPLCDNIYQKITVYNLEINEVPEYYVEGVLVHNCPDCADMNGRVFQLVDIKGLIPLHANCRCLILPHLPNISGVSGKYRADSIGGEYFRKDGTFRKQDFYGRHTSKPKPKRITRK